MPEVVRQYLGRSALHNCDQRLAPAIIACNFSICILLFGVFMTISGAIFMSFVSTPGTAILSVGLVVVLISIALLIFAMVTFKRYQTQRISELQTANSAPNLNYETGFTNTTIYPAPTPMSYNFGHPATCYRPQTPYTIQNEFEPPPSYSSLPHNNHQIINKSEK